MKASAIILMSIMLLACTSVVQRENGTWDVPKKVEDRSLFGTNQSALYITNCKTVVHHAIGSDEYLNCEPITNYHFGSSQGQGGQIVGGVAAGLGLGLGMAFSGAGSTQVNNNQTDVRASTVNPK